MVFTRFLFTALLLCVKIYLYLLYLSFSIVSDLTLHLFKPVLTDNL